MKYCPYCGAALAAGDSSYCVECGRELVFVQPERKGSTPQKKKKKRFKSAPEREDADAQRDGVDKGLIKRIVLLTLMVAAVIAGCVVALYLL